MITKKLMFMSINTSMHKIQYTPSTVHEVPFLDIMAEETKQTFSCSFCPKSFSYMSGLSRHTKKEHPMEKETNSNIICSVCSSR